MWYKFTLISCAAERLKPLSFIQLRNIFNKPIFVILLLGTLLLGGKPTEFIFTPGNNLAPPGHTDDLSETLRRKKVEENLRPPSVETGGLDLDALLERFLLGDPRFISFFLSHPELTPWFDYCLRQLLTNDPPMNSDHFFSRVIIPHEKDHLVVQYFYRNLEAIDPAKAGLIILYLINFCEEMIKGWEEEGDSESAIEESLIKETRYHIELLNRELRRIASLWKLDPENIPFLKVFLIAKLMDRTYLDKEGYYIGGEGTVCLRHERYGTVAEIKAPHLTSQEIVNRSLDDRIHSGFSIFFPDDVISYWEERLQSQRPAVPFRRMIQREIEKRKKPQPQTEKASFNIASLFGYVVFASGTQPQDLGVYFTRFMTDLAETEQKDKLMELLETITVVHSGVKILLKPDANLKGGWIHRRTPYQILGFVHGRDLYPIPEEFVPDLKNALANLPPSEITHCLVLQQIDLKVPQSGLLKISSTDRDAIYRSHDLALEREMVEIVSSVEGPISIVDVGMGGGELISRLRKKVETNSRVKIYGNEPDPNLRKLAQVRNPQLKFSGLPGENLSAAYFANTIKETFQVAILEGVTTFGVNTSKKGGEILKELFKMGFDKIFLTGNMQVNIDFKEIAPIFDRYGYKVERTLYPQNLFNFNLPKIMFVISKVEKVEGPTIKSSL